VPEVDYNTLKRACSAKQIALDFVFETIIEEFYSNWLDSGDTAIDCGAHTGRHLFPLSSVVGRHGVVFGFEPLPELVQALLVRVQSLGNAVILPYALSDKVGSTTFVRVKNAPAYSGIKQRKIFNEQVNAGLEIEHLSVMCSTIDATLSWSNQVRFIKMDLEGGEYHALMGAR
jgi:FkbM family methyltransferase